MDLSASDAVFKSVINNNTPSDELMEKVEHGGLFSSPGVARTVTSINEKALRNRKVRDLCNKVRGLCTFVVLFKVDFGISTFLAALLFKNPCDSTCGVYSTWGVYFKLISVARYNTIQYNTIQYNTMQCNAICNAMQCNAIQYNTLFKG